MDRNLHQAQLRYDALEKPDKTFRAGKCWLYRKVEAYIEVHRTEDGELELIKGELNCLTDGAEYIVPFNEEGLKTLIKLNEQEMAEEAEAL